MSPLLPTLPTTPLRWWRCSRKPILILSTLRKDLPVAEMRRALRDFGAKARDADVAVIYYAGHGIELDGVNYLIPIDAQLENDTDVFDETLALDRVLVAIEPAKQLRLVILDACRDNPFSKTMRRTIGSRSVSRGLAKVEPANPNTMIAFAAKAGFTALDGDGKSSPYTTALTERLSIPGLDLRKAFGFVRDDVLKATGHKQEPFVYGSLGGNDVVLVPAPVVAAQPAQVAPDPNSAIRRDYEMAEKVGTREAWDFFISTYPDGFYAKLAQAQRNKLAAEEARLAATERARLAAEEKARLAAEGARASEQAKADAKAREAESARVASERRKALEEAKVAEAERVKAVAQAKADKDAVAAEARADRNKPVGPVATLTSPEETGQATPQQDGPSVAEIARMLKSELRRVGCNTGAVDDNWNMPAQQSMEFFNKSTGMKLDVKIASKDSLDAVKSRNGRVCPLICDSGFKIDGDRCLKITCGPGSFLNDNNECEKKREREKSARRDDPSVSIHPDRERAKPAGSSASCTFMMGKCATVCVANTGRPDCASTICVGMRARCLATGCWAGRGFNGCGLARR